MAIYGYARVSTTDQDCSIQEAALRDAGCDVIRSEKASGRTRVGRAELDTLLAFVRPGDMLVVTRLDRLGRSVPDLYAVAQELDRKGVTLRVIEQAVDTSTAAGKAFFGFLAVVSVFEADLRAERQAEGIAAAKAKGVYKGRKPTIDADEVRRLHAEGVGPSEIAKRLDISRNSVYRLLGQPAAA